MYFQWAVMYAIQLIVIMYTEALNIVPVNHTVIEQNGTRHIISNYLFVPQDNNSDPNQTLNVSNDEVISRFLKEIESSKSLPNFDNNVDTYKIYIKRTLKGKPQGTIEIIGKDGELKDFKQEDSNMIAEDNLHNYNTINKFNITVLQPETDIVNNNKFDFIKNEHAEAITLNSEGKGRSDQIDGISGKKLIFKQAKPALNIQVTKDQVDQQDGFNDDSVRVIPLKADNISYIQEKSAKGGILTQGTANFENNYKKPSNLDEQSKQLYGIEMRGLNEKLNEPVYYLDTLHGETAKANVIMDNITNKYPNSVNHDEAIIKRILVTLQESPEKYLDKSVQQEKELKHYALEVNDKVVLNATRRHLFENNTDNQAAPIHSDVKSYDIFIPDSVQFRTAHKNSVILKKNMENALSMSDINSYPLDQTYLLNKSSQNTSILVNQSQIPTKVLINNYNDQENKSLKDQILQKDQQYKINLNEDEHELLYEFSLHENTSQQIKNESEILSNEFSDSQNPIALSLENNVKDIKSIPNFEVISPSNSIEPRNTTETGVKYNFLADILFNKSTNHDTTNNFTRTASHISDIDVTKISSEDLLHNAEILPTTIQNNNENKLDSVTDMTFQNKEPIVTDLLKRTNTEINPNFIEIESVHENLNYHNDEHHSSIPFSEFSFESNYLKDSGIKETKDNGDISLPHNRRSFAELIQNSANIQTNQRKTSGDVYINLIPLDTQTYNKKYLLNSEVPTFTHNSNQMLISYKQLLSVENLIKILTALEQEEATKYDKHLYSMYMIIKSILETVKSTGFNKNNETPWLTYINTFKGNSTKDYIYKLIQQKWMQDLLYQLYVNDYNVNVIKDPRWRIYLDNWYLPIQYQSMNNYNQKLPVDHNYDIYQVGIPREEVIAILNYIKPFIGYKVKHEGNINYDQYQKMIVRNVATYLKNKRYSDCSIRSLLCKLDKILNENNTNSPICLPTCCLIYN